MNSWIENEFKDSQFADLHIKQIILKMTSQLSVGFGQTISMACQDWATTKAAYRLLDNKRITEEEILTGHFSATGTRVSATDGHILILHDTSEFSYTREKNNIGNTGFVKEDVITRKSNRSLS